MAITGRIARETSMLPMAHLTCVGHTTDELARILASLQDSGVRNVLALRGDPLAGPGTAVGGRPTAASTTPPTWSASSARSSDLCVGVAAFPEGHRDAASLDDDVAVLKAKHDAGAEFAVTEMVLRASDYFGLVERAHAAGVDFPIIPGIMPILNFGSMAKMVELSGREMPDEVLARLEPLKRRPGRRTRRGHRDRHRAVRHPARGRRPGPALLHAQPVQGDARDLLGAPGPRLTVCCRFHYRRCETAAPQAGPITCATSAAERPTEGRPAPGWRGRRP